MPELRITSLPVNICKAEKAALQIFTFEETRYHCQVIRSTFVGQEKEECDCAFLQWITTFRRSTKWTSAQSKTFCVGPIGQTSRSLFIPFTVSTEDLPTCCGSPISLSSPRKSTTPWQESVLIQSPSFSLSKRDKVQEKLSENSPFDFVQNPTLANKALRTDPTLLPQNDLR